MRAAVVSMIYSHCSAEDLKPQSCMMPTTDSNKLEITVIQDTPHDLKISMASDKQEKKLLACEISKVQQESLTVALWKRNGRSVWMARTLQLGRQRQRMRR